MSYFWPLYTFIFRKKDVFHKIPHIWGTVPFQELKTRTSFFTPVKTKTSNQRHEGLRVALKQQMQ